MNIIITTAGQTQAAEAAIQPQIQLGSAGAAGVHQQGPTACHTSVRKTTFTRLSQTWDKKYQQQVTPVTVFQSPRIISNAVPLEPDVVPPMLPPLHGATDKARALDVDYDSDSSDALLLQQSYSMLEEYGPDLLGLFEVLAQEIDRHIMSARRLMDESKPDRHPVSSRTFMNASNTTSGAGFARDPLLLDGPDVPTALMPGKNNSLKEDINVLRREISAMNVLFSTPRAEVMNVLLSSPRAEEEVLGADDALPSSDGFPPCYRSSSDESLLSRADSLERLDDIVPICKTSLTFPDNSIVC